MNQPISPEQWDKKGPNWNEVAPTTDVTRRFEQRVTLRAGDQNRNWLRIADAIDVALWLDDRYLGESDTPFQPRILELTSEHESEATLAAEFLDPSNVRLPDVELFFTGPLRIARHKVLCTEATADRGTLELHVEIDSNVAGDIWIQSAVTDKAGFEVDEISQTHTVACGRNRLRWTFSVDNPKLWPGALYQVTTNTGTRLLDTGTPSHTMTTPVGFRSAYVDKNQLFVNGIEHAMDTSRLRRLPAVEPQQAYDEADRDGLLLCQCLPDDLDHARQVIDLLAHHPSIVAWSHPSPRGRLFRRPADAHGRTVARSDGTRPFLHE